MPSYRFFVRGSLDSFSRVSLEGEEFHHARHVMRLAVADTIELINGEGALASARISSFSKKNLVADILSSATLPRPLPKKILGLPFLRPSKLEWIVEKGTELGIDGFFLYPSALGEKKILSPSQKERLTFLMISSLKQSGRLFLPALKEVGSLSSLLQEPFTFYYGDAEASCFMEEVAFPLLFLTGPESGFSKEEKELLQRHASAVKLSDAVLRAETAPIVAASQVSLPRRGVCKAL